MHDDPDGGSDPALERVRRDLSRLGADHETAPEVPAEVTARVGAALRAAGSGPAHSTRPPRLSRLQRIGVLVALGAAIAGAVVGGVLLTGDPGPSWPAGPTAKSITRPAIPLPNHELAGLLTQAPDHGPLADAERRAACLAGLGYPSSTPVLGARPIDMQGRPAVVMLVPGGSAEAVVALVVEPNCGAGHRGLLAETVFTRP